MRNLIALVLFISATFADPLRWDIEPAIVGGTDAPAHAYPFMASLHWVIRVPATRSTHVCGGSLLNRRWILTAGHCLTELPRLGTIDVLLGNHDQRVEEAGLVRVEGVRDSSIVHPDWVPGDVGPEDMALIYLADNAIYSTTIQPIALPPRDVIPTGRALAAGWGSVDRLGLRAANVLQHTELPIIGLQVCRDMFNALGANGSLVDNTNICLGPEGGRGVCSGDSGGPMFQRQGTGFVIHGVVSWGRIPCASANAPAGVFKRVSAYIDWIAQHTGITS